MTLTCALVLAMAATSQAVPTPEFQVVPRFEFLWRLRQVESNWIDRKHRDSRVGVAEKMLLAERMSSAGDALRCAEALDEAASVMEGKTTQANWNHSWAVLPRRRLCDSIANEMTVALRTYYRPSNTQSVVVSARYDRSEDWCIHEELEAWGNDDLSLLTLDLVGQPAGDHALHLSLFNGDWFNSRRELTISVVEHRDERLAALKTALEAAREKGPRFEMSTAERLLALVSSLAAGSTEAHDYPGARLLAEAEQVVASAAKGERWYGTERDGEFFLALPIGDSAIPTRVFVPPGMTTEKPAPLVVALHGAVFDEDTWFDGYGGGQAKTLCAERGWMLAAPRCDGEEDAAKLDALVAVLAERYSIDKTRLFLVGHSRGGGSALTALSQVPTRFRGVATIGSALDVSVAPKIATAPLFLAAGESDFAREGVEGFHKALVAVGSKTASLHVYPQTEHWLAVTDALPDVFAWFDEGAR